MEQVTIQAISEFRLGCGKIACSQIYRNVYSDMPPYSLKPNSIELTLWLIQILLLGLALRRSPEINEDRTPSYLTCAFIVLLAWNWRLIYQFSLAASGFWYFVADDCARWELAWAWSRHPYLVTWDGIWQGGTFYLHGTAMRFVHDPLLASKLVSGFYSLLPLVGLFVLTQGLYRKCRFSLALVVFAAPLWIHLLLSTGTMAEMPIVGFMFAGVGLLFMSTDANLHHRNLLEIGAALCLAISTSFHMTAWMMLVPILLIYSFYVWWNRNSGVRMLRHWLLVSLISTSYCAVWIIGCWVKFGDPLQTFHNYSTSVMRDLGTAELSVRIWAYPDGIAYILRGILPLLIAGLILGVIQQGPDRRRARCAIGGAAIALLIMIESAIRTTYNTYRSVVVLATFLIPIAVAPLLPVLQNLFESAGHRPLNRYTKVTGTLILLFALLWFIDNHQRTIREQREQNVLYSDGIGVGAWLHQEFIRPQLLQLPLGGPPIRLWNPNPPVMGDFGILYAADYPDRLQRWTDPKGPGLDSMKAGQYLISNAKLDDRRLVRQFQFGSYTVYQFHTDP